MDSRQKQLISIAEKMQNYLDFLSGIGVRGVDCSERTLEILGSWGRKGAGGGESLLRINSEVKACRRCSLAGAEAGPVPGTGSRGARLMFVRAFPGPEDRFSGGPYSGKAGEMLVRMIKAMGMDTEEVYTSFAVKCTPAGEGGPGIREIKACSSFLKREIDAVGPEIVCPLGQIPLKSVLGGDGGFEDHRGRFHEYRGALLTATYSPEYLVSNPAAKRGAWNDLKKIMSEMKRKKKEES